jgi:hypothetical protein
MRGSSGVENRRTCEHCTLLASAPAAARLAAGKSAAGKALARDPMDAKRSSIFSLLYCEKSAAKTARNAATASVHFAWGVLLRLDTG